MEPSGQETGKHLSRAERRALERQMRHVEHTAGMQRRRIGKWLWYAFLFLMIGAIVWWVVYGFVQEKPGVKVAIQSREHIAPGTEHDSYTSNPPVSGPHFPDWSKCDVFEEEIPMERLIHNMEHGHVVVLYKPDMPAEEKEKLKTFVEEHLAKRAILMAPKKDISSNIVFASWGRYELFEAFDEKLMNRFYKVNRYRAPERIPCEVISR